jgi:hypothetical protein
MIYFLKIYVKIITYCINSGQLRLTCKIHDSNHDNFIINK